MKRVSGFKQTLSVLLLTMGVSAGVAQTQAAGVCDSCGTVLGVNTVQKEGETSGLMGGVAGGVLGGVIGNQFGKGTGKTLATVGGVAAGAVVGQQVEKKLATKTVYEVVVKFDAGGIKTITQDTNPGLKEGDKVRIVDGKVVLNQ